MAVHADTEAAGQVAAFNQARAWNEVVRVFGVDTALKRVAFDLNILLFVLQRQAGGDAELLLHDVHAGDELGNRMLDLNARVHLDKEKFAVFV